MANQWFRMYGEFINDPKVQMLSETDQRRYIMLLCIKCNGDVTLHDEQVAFQLRISNEEWLKTKDVLLSKKLIDENNNPANWDKRQYVSDSSNERVAKYRAKKKQECNVTVTPPETETDTETEDKKINKKTSVKFSDMVESVRGLSSEVASEYLDYRKKRAKTSLTPRAWKSIAKAINEFTVESGIAPDEILVKAMSRAWVGLEVDWLRKAFSLPNNVHQFPVKRQEEQPTNIEDPRHWAHGLKV